MTYAFSRLFDYKQAEMHFPCTKSEVREQPLNLTSITGASGNRFQIDLPRIENSFYIPSTFALNFRSTYTGSDASMGAVLLGNALSHFSNITCQGLKDGVVVDECLQPGLLHNLLVNASMNNAEKLGMQGWAYDACNGSGNFSRVITAGNNAIHSFSIPLLSVFAQSPEALPAFLSSFRFEFTLAAIADFTRTLTGCTALTGYTLDKISLSCNVTRFENDAIAILAANYPKMAVKSTGYIYTAANIPAGSVGRVTVPWNHSVSSAKEVFMYAAVADAWDKQYGGVGIARGIQLIVNGSRRVPTHPLDCLSPAEIMKNLSICFDSYSSTNAASSITRQSINSINSTDGEMGEYVKSTAALTAPDAELGLQSLGRAMCNMTYIGIDLEGLSSNDTSSLYTGISTREGTGAIELDIHTALPSAATLYFWTSYDKIVSFDLVANRVEVVI